MNKVHLAVPIGFMLAASIIMPQPAAAARDLSYLREYVQSDDQDTLVDEVAGITAAFFGESKDPYTKEPMKKQVTAMLFWGGADDFILVRDRYLLKTGCRQHMRTSKGFVMIDLQGDSVAYAIMLDEIVYLENGRPFLSVFFRKGTPAAFQSAALEQIEEWLTMVDIKDTLQHFKPRDYSSLKPHIIMLNTP